MASNWTSPRRDLPGRVQGVLWLLSFLLPLAAWSAISYVPWLWHPQVLVSDAGGSTFLSKGMRVDRAPFDTENVALAASGRPLAVGTPANPIFLPAPHEIAHAMVAAFSAEPYRGGKTWAATIWHSCSLVLWSFLAAMAVGVPIGIACGNWRFLSGLIEPFTSLVRYMPAPVFGALAVALYGLSDAPKIAIIFIGTVFPMILVVANTTRQVDGALLEAAQTLGARNKQLVLRVILPGMLPSLLTDLRILLGAAWIYLTAAELIGEKSGITMWMEQSRRGLRFPEVYAGIMTIGIIGLACDQILAWAGRHLFPWAHPAPSKASQAAWRIVSAPVRWALRPVGAFIRHCIAQHAATEARIAAIRDQRNASTP
jgi:NitT/TauT family transport system permease protein